MLLRYILLSGGMNTTQEEVLLIIRPYVYEGPHNNRSP